MAYNPNTIEGELAGNRAVTSYDANMDAYMNEIVGPKGEGGYVDDPTDRGGETKYGISKQQYPDLDIASLTPEDAQNIYRTEFLGPIESNYGKNPIALKMLDISINAGGPQGTGIMQRALQSLGYDVEDDMKMGPGTKKVYETAMMEHGEDAVLNALSESQGDYYKSIVEQDPSQEKFLGGWLNRAKRYGPGYQFE